jgi:hypothetical protein
MSSARAVAPQQHGGGLVRESSLRALAKATHKEARLVPWWVFAANKYRLILEMLPIVVVVVVIRIILQYAVE